MGLSILSGSHMELAQEVLDALSALGAADIKVLVGGSISAEDQAALLTVGVEGPYANRPAYDYVVQAMTGVMALTGDPDAPPTKAG